jgi:hypothetical protein
MASLYHKSLAISYRLLTRSQFLGKLIADIYGKVVAVYTWEKNV